MFIEPAEDFFFPQRELLHHRRRIDLYDKSFAIYSHDPCELC